MVGRWSFQVSIWATPFSGAFAVSFREGTHPKLFRYLVRRCEIFTPESRTTSQSVWMSGGVFIEHLALVDQRISHVTSLQCQRRKIQASNRWNPKMSSANTLIVSSCECHVCHDQTGLHHVPCQTKHCVATSCVFSYLFYPPTSPRFSSGWFHWQLRPSHSHTQWD